jgi:hypothetical protein
MWGVAFFVGRSSVEKHYAAPSGPSIAHPIATKLPTSRRTTPVQHVKAEQRSFLVRPVELFVAKDDDAARRYRAQQSKDLIALVASRANLAEHMMGPANVEAAANMMDLYVSGWVETVMRTAPDLIDDLAAEMNSTFCDTSTRPTLLLMLMRIGMQMPELVDPKGLECLLSQHTSEDQVLWHSLRLLRVSGLPKPASFANIEQTASDPRTREILAAIAEGRRPWSKGSPDEQFESKSDLP